jgi:hypothetical protein
VLLAHEGIKRHGCRQREASRCLRRGRCYTANYSRRLGNLELKFSSALSDAVSTG